MLLLLLQSSTFFTTQSIRKTIVKIETLALAALTLTILGCSESADPTIADTDLPARALEIARESIIVDTHIDVPVRLQYKPDDISVATEGGDFDYPRAIAGALNAPFMSIYTAASLEAENRSFETAEMLIDMVEGFVTASPEKFAIALSPADVREHFERGLISLPMGMENGSPIDGDINKVSYFYDRGIRYITLAHSLSNHISDSSYDENRQWNGLSDFGVEVVREMNRLGIMIDVSHVSDEAFWQVMDITEVPVIASHSSARHFTPDFERNMSDEMIQRLAQNGGVMQINFGSSFVTAEAREYSSARTEYGKAFKAEHPDLSSTELRALYYPPFIEENGPFPFATLDDVLDHFDHVVGLVGVDLVGIGSDFDGVGDSLPIGLKDVSTYPALIEGLLRRGYSEPDIRKILGENLLRVWKEVEAHAASAASTT